MGTMYASLSSAKLFVGESNTPDAVRQVRDGSTPTRQLTSTCRCARPPFSRSFGRKGDTWLRLTGSAREQKRGRATRVSGKVNPNHWGGQAERALAIATSTLATVLSVEASRGCSVVARALVVVVGGGRVVVAVVAVVVGRVLREGGNA